MVRVPVVGIPKWGWKRPLTEWALDHPGIYQLDITDFCYECSRHSSTLKLFSKNGDLRNSDYYRFQRSVGRSDDSSYRRTLRFLKLYKSIKRKGCLEPPVVTDDGCRLNGSHRIAILLSLGQTLAHINLVRYEDFFDSKKCLEIRKQVTKYRRKKYCFNA